MFSYPSIAYDPEPFPHCIVRGAWDDDTLLACKAELADFGGWTGVKDETRTLHKKWCSEHAKLPPNCRAVIEYSCQPPFMAWLESVTGESGLMYDHMLKGAGVHRISRGGFLGMHVDFTHHAELKLYRRLNVLLYLNEWQDEWGGHLELAYGKRDERRKLVAPQRNTMVVFSTSDKSWHGHPHPLTCPEGEYRDSIALYYYSRTPHDKLRETTKYVS